MKIHMNRRTENEPSVKEWSLGMLLKSLLCNVCNLKDRWYHYLESDEAVPTLQFHGHKR